MRIPANRTGGRTSARHSESKESKECAKRHFGSLIFERHAWDKVSIMEAFSMSPGRQSEEA